MKDYERAKPKSENSRDYY